MASCQTAFRSHGEHPLVSLLKLVSGIIFAILSVLWVLHILLYMLIKPGSTPVSPFFNSMLAALGGSDLFVVGIVVFAVLTSYLLACVVKGGHLRNAVFVIFQVRKYSEKLVSFVEKGFLRF